MSLLDWEQSLSKEEAITSIRRMAVFFSTLEELCCPTLVVATHCQQCTADTGRMQVFSADKNLPFPCLSTNHHPTLCIVMMFCTVSSGLITAQLVFLASKVQYSDNRNIVTHFTLRSCTMLMVLSETNIYIRDHSSIT